MTEAKYYRWRCRGRLNFALGSKHVQKGVELRLNRASGAQHSTLLPT
jgi:hypothetical protein